LRPLTAASWEVTKVKHHRKFSPVLLGALALVMLGSPSSFGAVYVKLDSPGPVLNGASWGTAYHTVQGGLDTAVSGDEVWVAAETYVENITLKSGVALYGGFAGTETAREQRNWTVNVTVLDGGQAGRVVTAPSGATASTRIDGFTIRNGSVSDADGGGIYCDSSSPTITNNTITGNTTSYDGGGIYCYDSSPTIANNTITGNTASYDGGGIYCYDSSPTITNNVIDGNDAADDYGYGGAIYCWYSSPTIANNTLTGNHASQGGGICCDSDSSPTLLNNIVAFNSSGIYRYGSCTPTLRYNCVYGNTAYEYSGIGPGTGDISADPGFVDPGNADYRLPPSSPCTDAADGDAAPPTDIAGSARYDHPLIPDTGTGSPTYADIGAYEYIPASIDLPGTKLLEDLWAVDVSGLIVSRTFTGYFYAQTEDRSVGVRVESQSIVYEKDRVDVVGVVRTNSAGERYIDASAVTLVGTVADLRPIGFVNGRIGGGDWFYNESTGAGQKGIAGASGLNNIGLVIRTWGRVTYANTDYFYLDDGSALNDGSGHIGLKVWAPGLTIPAQGSRAQVTGISSCFKPDGNLRRLILVSTPDDIVELQ